MKGYTQKTEFLLNVKKVFRFWKQKVKYGGSSRLPLREELRAEGIRSGVTQGWKMYGHGKWPAQGLT